MSLGADVFIYEIVHSIIFLWINHYVRKFLFATYILRTKLFVILYMVFYVFLILRPFWRKINLITGGIESSDSKKRNRKFTVIIYERKVVIFYLNILLLFLCLKRIVTLQMLSYWIFHSLKVLLSFCISRHFIFLIRKWLCH